MLTKRVLTAVAAASVLLLAGGCSGGSDQPAASSAPPESPAQTAAASPSSKPAAECLTGSYQLARFVGVGDKATYGTGEGGDLRARFTDGSYQLGSDGGKPIKLTLAGQSADMTVDGTIAGSYQATGDQASFEVGKVSGTALLRLGTLKQNLTMDQVASVLAPKGSATITCTGDVMIATFAEVRLEFSRV